MNFRNTKKYCYSVTEEEIPQNALVGNKAHNLNRVHQLNVNMPSAFVLSAEAFDEYLIKNNFVDLIINSLNGIQDENDRKIAKISKEITEKILEGDIPKNVGIEIKKSYDGLSSYGESFVAVRQSALNDELDEKSYNRESTGYVNIKGFEMLLEYIRQVWADLFSEQAIRYRASIDYEGSLSQPVLVQRMINAEVSGLLYNFDVNTKRASNVTMLANLGMSQPNENNFISSTADYYLVEKIHSKVISKILNEQKFMLIKSNEDPSKPFSEVKISKIWSNKQKLDETQLKKIMTFLALIESEYAERLEVEWIYESGSFYVIQIREMSEREAQDLPEISWPEDQFYGISGIRNLDLAADKTLLKPDVSVEKSSKVATDKKNIEVSTKSLASIEEQPKSSEDSSDPVEKSAITIDLGEKEKLLEFMKKKDEEEIKLSDEERETKADSIKEMLPEVKTITEVWWSNLKQSSELKVFVKNLDGLGIFRLSEVIKTLALKADPDELRHSQKTQKKICDYLALYLNAVNPKPILIQLENDIDLEGQIQVLSQLRNLYGHRNFWCILPELDSIDQISDLKTELSSNGFRRISTFKMYQKISQPLYLSNLSAVIDQAVDGIVVDVEELYFNSMGLRFSKGLTEEEKLTRFEILHKKPDYDLFLNFLMENLVEKSQLKLFTILDVGSKPLLDKMLPTLLDVGINGVIYHEEDLYDFKQTLADQENQILTNSLKKIKESLDD